MDQPESIDLVRRRKMDRIRPFLRDDMPHSWRDGRADYLTDELRAETRIIDTANVSSLGYDADMQALIDKHKGGLVLDCGAGSKSDYLEHVYNLEIVPYGSTDILAVGEYLPFKDDTFDAVLSVAVLEHVRDPFRCAEEITRVLKPGGDLLCAIPFMSPLHGYPHHYFNATPQGHLRLYEGKLVNANLALPDACHPIFSLQWVLQSWVDGLAGHADTQAAFREMRVADLLDSPWTLVERPFSRDLPVERQFEIASGTVLSGQKMVRAPEATAMPPAGRSGLRRAGDAIEAMLGPAVRLRIGALLRSGMRLFG